MSVQSLIKPIIQQVTRCAIVPIVCVMICTAATLSHNRDVSMRE